MGYHERKTANKLVGDRKLRRQLRAIVQPPPERSLHRHSKAELVELLQGIRDAWELLTRRNQDLPDERLESETKAELVSHAKWYFSDEARAIAAHYLVEVIQHMGGKK